MLTFMMFRRENMLIEISNCGQWAIIDRLPMRSCRQTKNCRNRYQVISADQSRYMLYRSLAAALAGMAEVSRESSEPAYSVFYWDSAANDWASNSDTDTDSLDLAREFANESDYAYIVDNFTNQVIYRTSATRPILTLN